jgi:hypothetical protein
VRQRILFEPAIPKSLGHLWMGYHVEPLHVGQKPCEICHGSEDPELGSCGPVFRLDDGVRVCQRCLMQIWKERWERKDGSAE